MPNARTLGSGGKFTPRKISGLALWLDASQTGDLYTTDAGPVDLPSGWTPNSIASGKVAWYSAENVSTVGQGLAIQEAYNQFSGNGTASSVTQGASAKRPYKVLDAINGLPVMRFSGAQGLQGSGDNTYYGQINTVVAVCRINAAADNSLPGRLLSAYDFNNDKEIAVASAASSTTNIGVLNTTFTTHAPLLASAGGFSDYQLLSVTNGVGGLVSRANGLTAATGSAQTWDVFYELAIGGDFDTVTWGFNGDIAEILVFSTELSSTDRLRLERWLGQKYGLAEVHAPASEIFSTALAAMTSPLEISGCIGWYDAGDLSAMKQNTDGTGEVAVGGSVGYWQDKSATGAHVTQGLSAKRPVLTANSIGGKAALVFDGSDDFLLRANYSAQSSLSGLTRIAVLASTGTGVRAFSRANNGGGFFHFVNAGIRNYAGPDVFASDLGYTDVHPALISTSVYGGLPKSLLPRRNGTQSAYTLYGASGTITASGIPGTTATGSGNLSIGCNDGVNFFWQGPVAEYIIFNRTLTQYELARVEAYLAVKWSITAYAPATPPVGYWRDKSGNARHAQSTAASRPTISATQQNGRNALAFNGSSQSLSVASYNAENGLPGLTRYVVASMSSAGPTLITRVYNGGGDALFGTVSGEIRFFAGANAYSAVASTNYGLLTSGTHIIGSVYDGAAGSVATGIRPYYNGAAIPPSSTSGTLPTTLPSGTPGFWIGSNIGVNSFWPGRIVEYISYSRALGNTERQRLERYLAAKYGITLAPQVSNADAQDWINRVYANGGTVTPSTAAAVNTFCNAIDAAGIRSRFFRLNPYCGTLGSSIQGSGVVVPLYRGIAAGSGGNFLTRSTTRDGGSFSSAVWETIGSSPVPTKNGDVASPNGSLTATSVTYGATSGYSALRWSSNYAGGWTANATGTFSVWARKPVTGGAASIRLTTNNAAAWNTGVSQKFALTTEWQRLSVTGNLSTSVDMFALIGTGDASGGIDTDCIGTVELWRPQVEVGSTATAWQACQYGNLTDTQNGFATSNYSEADGLLGAVNRYLATGLSPDTVGVSTGHVSIWAKADAASSAALAIGSRNSDASQRYEISTANRNAFQGGGITDFYATQAWGGTIGQAYQTTGSAARPGGMYLATRTSGTRIDFYLNASSVANSTASVTPGANSNEFYVQAQNSNGTATFTGATTCRGYSIGLSLDSTQVASLYSAWSALQTALGRS